MTETSVSASVKPRRVRSSDGQFFVLKIFIIAI